jgi:hypothetical protein
MRQHREELELALRYGISLDAARERLTSYRDHQARLKADDQAPVEEPERELMWWQK